MGAYGFKEEVAMGLAEQVMEYRKAIKELVKEYKEREQEDGYSRFLDEEFGLAYEVIEGQIRVVYDIAKRFGVTREQVNYWVKEDNT